MGAHIDKDGLQAFKEAQVNSILKDMAAQIEGQLAKSLLKTHVATMNLVMEQKPTPTRHEIHHTTILAGIVWGITRGHVTIAEATNHINIQAERIGIDPTKIFDQLKDVEKARSEQG
jgi:hypothetical protein